MYRIYFLLSLSIIKFDIILVSYGACNSFMLFTKCVFMGKMSVVALRIVAKRCLNIFIYCRNFLQYIKSVNNVAKIGRWYTIIFLLSRLYYYYDSFIIIRREISIVFHFWPKYGKN